MKDRYVDQRTIFVETLYNNLKKEAEKAQKERDKFASIAASYIDSGLSDSECIELLIVDGISREAAKSYVTMVKDNANAESEDNHEYTFVFEDSYGNVFSSYDINRVIYASSEQDAWEKAEELTGDDTEFEINSIISVDRVD